MLKAEVNFKVPFEHKLGYISIISDSSIKSASLLKMLFSMQHCS